MILSLRNLMFTTAVMTTTSWVAATEDSGSSPGNIRGSHPRSLQLGENPAVVDTAATIQHSMLLNGLTCTTPTAGEGTVSCSFTTVPNPNTSFERCLETTELGGQFCISFQPTVPLPPPVIALPPAPVVVAPLPAPPVVVAAPPIVTVAPPQPPLAGTLPAWNPLAPALPLPAPPQPPPTPPQPVVPVNAALVSTDSYSRMFTLIVVCLSHPSSSIDPSIYLFAVQRSSRRWWYHHRPVWKSSPRRIRFGENGVPPRLRCRCRVSRRVKNYAGVRI